MPEAYRYKTDPWPHQRWVFEETRDRDVFGLFLEQRLGKTKVTLDTAAWLWGQGRINALLLSAPNGVHRSWVSGDADAGDHPQGHVGDHLPEHVPRRVAYWRSPGDARQAERKALDALFDDRFRGLRILAVNLEALALSQKARDFTLRFLHTFTCMWVVDESTRIKNLGGSKVADWHADHAPLAPVRRVLTGEPNPEGPTDLWGQLKFLEDAPLGFSSFYSYRARYCELTKRAVPHPKKPGAKLKFTEVTGLKNEAELRRNLAEVSVTLKRADCVDVPEEVRTTRQVLLTREQQRAYDQLRDEWLYELDRRGDDELDAVEVNQALTRLLRLSQVCGGFLPYEDGTYHAFEPNPKLEALLAEADELPPDAKLVVWARFKPELRAVRRALERRFGEQAVVGYYGEVKPDERQRNKARFQCDPTCRFFVGNPQAGRYDLTLNAANDVVWYSWGYPLEDYIQANDRVVKVGDTRMLTYQHLVVPGSTEAKLLGDLRAKRDVANRVRSPVNLRELLGG